MSRVVRRTKVCWLKVEALRRVEMKERERRVWRVVVARSGAAVGGISI